MRTRLLQPLVVFLKLGTLLALGSCVPLSDGSSYPGGYSSSYGYPYGGYHRPTYGDYERRRRDWERHREREEERRDWERRRDEALRERPLGTDPDRNRPPPIAPPPLSPPPQKVENRCPPGFVEGHHRCTDSERRRGCKDIGGPNGFGCNNIGWAR